MNILERIDKLRNDRGWSIHKLSKEAGLKQSTVNNLFERNNLPTLPTLEKLCAAFGISLAEFFGECKEQVLTREQKSLLNEWDKLTMEQKKNLLPILIKGIN
ncbi:MAG: helix-turn-helix domain-containing protein [Defluviitaleaceae bacterium]|nr:helix-turn-helix domain-containing protein [Defluviitaleaceae bacterium]